MKRLIRTNRSIVIGLLALGYYCIAANSLWGRLHPDQNYGTPSEMHIPTTKDYIDYDNSLPLPVADYLKRPIAGFDGTDPMTINDRNIAALIRFYLGKPVDPPPPWPEDMRCEYLENPLGIDAPKPRLSWKLKTGNPETEKGIKQTAYQVLVASSRALLKKEQGDVWDSGKVASDQSVLVEYQGKPLESGKQCFWKVKVWTVKAESANRKPGTETVCGWSEPALWTMGLLDPADWKGEWIRFKQADETKHIWYRKKFSLESAPSGAFAYLCSIGYHGRCAISSSENLGLWKGGGEGEYGGELIDARRQVPDWNKPSFDDGHWANATIYQKSLILSAEMQEPDRKVATLAPVAITETNGRYRIDMGRNFTGWFEIDLRNGRAGEVVKIMTANRAEETLEFRQESQYIFDAGGKGTFCHRFNYMAGRWITIEGLSYRPEPQDIRGYIVTNDRKRIGGFECSNKLFNGIYETDLRTYLACTVNGVTMDCPHRERFGYGEVALACAWGCAIPNFESAPYYRKAARDWFDVQRDDGFVNTIAPQVYKGAGGTLWSSAPVTLSWEFYKAYGDRRFLEEAYQPMKKWLDFLNKSVSAEGVLTSYEQASRFLGDWATPHGSEYGNTPEAKLFNNCVYAYCLDVLVQAAEILDKPDDVATYSARLANLRKNAHRHFFNEKTKT
ncbi:MAG: family 78 glycoside hydrolase catalytic domain [Verrucomicrobia bacterium]|nr:family 78 glycoside hydrolase catalytic domain [Verrucomicrobiota bacterium]